MSKNTQETKTIDSTTSMAAAMEEALRNKAEKESSQEIIDVEATPVEEVHVGIAEGGETEASDDFISVHQFSTGKKKPKKESKKERKEREKAKKKAAKEAKKKAAKESAPVEEEKVPAIVVEPFDMSYVVGTEAYREKFLNLRSFFDNRLRTMEAMAVYGEANYDKSEMRDTYLAAVNSAKNWIVDVCMRTGDVAWLEKEQTSIERSDGMINIFNYRQYLEKCLMLKNSREMPNDLAEKARPTYITWTEAMLKYIKMLENIRPMTLDKSGVGDRFKMFDEDARKKPVESSKKEEKPKTDVPVIKSTMSAVSKPKYSVPKEYETSEYAKCVINSANNARKILGEQTYRILCG